MAALNLVLNLLDRAWTTLCRPLITLLNMLFRPDPRTGSIRAWKVIVWIILNGAVLLLALSVLDARIKAAVIGLFLLLHILIILGSLRVMSEEKSVLEGSLTADRMTFSVFDAVNNAPLLSASIALYLLGLPALIGLIEDGGIARILSRRPPIPIPYVANLACVLNEMPGVGPVLNAIANLIDLSPNLNADIVYTGFAGNIARLFIVATIGYMVVQAIVFRIQQASHRRAIVHSIEAGHGGWGLVESRILRLPHQLAERLHRIGAAEKDLALRQRVEATLSKLAHPFQRPK